jgi:anaerobic selenocysteine-containing dehydrogenase
VLVDVEEGRVSGIRGDKDHPFSAGFICTKGQHALALHEHADRVHVPLKRAGVRGAGRWRELGWDEALDEIADRIRELSGRHGPETLALGFGTFHGADFGIGQRLLNLFGSPNAAGQDKICYGPGALGEALTYGFGPTFFSQPIPGRTRCMVVWGLRPSASTPLLWRQITRAQRAGAKLVVVDPERVRETNAADLWLPVRPGTDAALALSIIHCLVESGRYDAAFVAAHTSGFDDLRARAAQYPPAVAAHLTGLAVAQIEQVAQLLWEHRPAIVHAGNGICQSGRAAVQTGRALACLVAITGNLRVEGGHMLGGPPYSLVANGDACAAGALPAAQAAKRLGAERFPLLGSGFAALDEAMAPACHGRTGTLQWLTTAHEPSLWRAILGRRPYPVTALILQHHNPAGASANAGLAAAALASPNLELFIAHDLFLTASSHLADYVLPAAHWLEKPFFSMGLGSIGFAGDYVEAKPAPLPPGYAHRSDYDFCRDLGRRLGQVADWPDTAEQFWADCLAPAGLDFATVAATVGPLMGPPARGPERPRAGTPRPWGTPSGRIELRSGLMAAWGQDPLPAFEPPPLVRDAGGDYPLVLTTGGRRIEGLHQEAQLMPAFRRRYPEPQVSLHPDTAVRAGIADGSWVWVETPVGRVRQRARLTTDLPPDVVHADRWWYPERGGGGDDPFGWRGTNINVCTDDAAENCDPVLGTWLLRGLPCRVVADRDA